MGPLSNLARKFDGGHLPEQLCKGYTKQVLEGLFYLHSQGVVHRDIKGANILVTRNGVIKLADFGTSTKMSENRKSDSVVGTPYWMAPEIIEMSGIQDTACDVWSVGCTVIELLTGKPPYFDLPQMTAMFRIVQDDHPPLPDNISPALKDFLLLCFNKDPYQRLTAEGGLRHQWLKGLPAPGSDPVPSLDTEPVTPPPTDEPTPKSTIALTEAELNDDFPLEDELPEFPIAAAPQNDEDDPFAGIDDDSDDAPLVAPKTLKVREESDVDIFSERKVATSRPNLADFAEDDDDDDLDFGDAEPDGGFMIDQRQTASASQDEADMDDPFADIAFDEKDDEEILRGQRFAKLVENLKGKDETEVMETLDHLSSLFRENPVEITALFTGSNGGVIPMMELLETQNMDLLQRVLQVLNIIVVDNSKLQQSLSIVGLIPAVIAFSGVDFPSAIRLEAANFIRQFCYSSDRTRKMFVACGGIPILVSFLQEEYTAPDKKTLIWNSIDCIRHIFEITSSPKNDFCRLFCKFGLMQPLTKTFYGLCSDRASKDAEEYMLKLAETLYWFSQGDKVVRRSFANPVCIEYILQSLHMPGIPQAVVLLILKSIRHISMEPSTLDLLEEAGAIPALIPFLNSHVENQNVVLACMYDLCKIKMSRQNQAAASGIIPPLQRIIRSDLPVKQFAYPVMFLLAKSSATSRLELKKYGGVQIYLDLLGDLYWRTDAMEVLVAWLQEAPIRVEFILNKPWNVNALISMFKSTAGVLPQQMSKLLHLLHKLVKLAPIVAETLGNSAVFIAEMERMFYDPHIMTSGRRNVNAAGMRIDLLNILLAVLEMQPASVIQEYGLEPTLKRLAADESNKIVHTLASDLLNKSDPEDHFQE